MTDEKRDFDKPYLTTFDSGIEFMHCIIEFPRGLTKDETTVFGHELAMMLADASWVTNWAVTSIGGKIHSFNLSFKQDEVAKKAAELEASREARFVDDETEDRNNTP